MSDYSDQRLERLVRWAKSEGRYGDNRQWWNPAYMHSALRAEYREVMGHDIDEDYQ